MRPPPYGLRGLAERVLVGHGDLELLVDVYRVGSNENAYEIEKAIDKIVAADPINIYKKLKITVPDEDTLGQTA